MNMIHCQNLLTKIEVPIKEIKEIFTDKEFYKYYKKKWL